MERYSDWAIEIINELHRERLDYQSEYLPLIDAANKLSAYEDTGLEPEQVMSITIDPESLRPHGRWIFHHMTGSQAYYARCSECRKLKHFASENDEKKERYCFWCGARMEEDKT